MKKVMVFLGAAILFSGCKISTNIPLFYGYGLEVVNASDYDIELTVNGQLFNKEKLKPGESTTIRLRNYSGYAAESTVTAKAWYAHGKFAGATSVKLRIYGDINQSDSWIISNEDFRNQYYHRRYRNWIW